MIDCKNYCKGDPSINNLNCPADNHFKIPCIEESCLRGYDFLLGTNPRAEKEFKKPTFPSNSGGNLF